MTDGHMKLSIAFGERDRAGGRFLADELVETLARHRVEASVFLRGIEGFGASQQLRTDLLLSLSEDLPMIIIAIDQRATIEEVLTDVEGDVAKGLITLEDVRLVTGSQLEIPWREQAETKLTVHLGRRDRVGSDSAGRWIVQVLHDRGIAGATLLLGVDGTRHGERERARFFERNVRVPQMIIAVGSSDRIADVVPDIADRLPTATLTLERVRVCKRDGHTLGTPLAPALGEDAWQKLTIYTGEQSTSDAGPIHEVLVRQLREQHAAGATCVRGVWGFHGEHAPHGDRLWQLRRRVPIMTTVIDTPDRARNWYAIADELTANTGLITSELVPVVQTRTPDASPSRPLT